jgi:DNA-binding MarR family transcriptional regulator
MSINAMQCALRQPLNGCQKFVLFILAYHANETFQCLPGLETIAEECGISRATTICHINEICALGLISKKHRCDNRGYRRSTLLYASYRLRY